MNMFLFADTAVSASTTAAAPAATTTQPADAAAPGAGAPDQPGGILGGPWVMILIMFALFYFMMIRPQQRKEKQRRKMIDELRAGAKVVFAGGFIGKIVEAKEKTFRIELTDGVVVEVARSAVQTVLIEEK